MHQNILGLTALLGGYDMGFPTSGEWQDMQRSLRDRDRKPAPPSKAKLKKRAKRKAQTRARKASR